MPAKAGIQYAIAHKAMMTAAGWLQERSLYRRTLKKSRSSVAASVSPTAE